MGEARSTGHQPSSRRLGLRARFVAVISLVLLLIFSLTAVVLLRNARSTLVTDLNQNATSFAALATRPIGDAYSTFQNYGSLRVQQEIHKFTALNSTISNVIIVDTTGQQLHALVPHDVPVISPTLAASFTPTTEKDGQGADSLIVQPYFASDGQHSLAVAYTVSSAQLQQNIRHSAEVILVFAALGLIVAAAITYVLINRLFLRPLEGVSRASLAISQGNYSQQVKGERNDEIGDLARSVNQMATNLKNDIFKLQEVDTLKNEFIMITSHNLRTPLTVIEGYMEILRDADLTADIRQMISAIQGGLRNLAAFSEDILTIASIESDGASLTVRQTTIEELTKGIRDSYADAAQAKQLELDWQVDQPAAPIKVSATHIRGVLRNLLDNAIKFSKAGGTVSLHIRPQGSDLLLEVRDSGIGIAPEEMNKLFTKFHRGTSTYTYDYEGTGIGLYATKLIVQAHGGTVTATSALGQGSSFTVRLPGAVVTDGHGTATENS